MQHGQLTRPRVKINSCTYNGLLARFLEFVVAQDKIKIPEILDTFLNKQCIQLQVQGQAGLKSLVLETKICQSESCFLTDIFCALRIDTHTISANF